MTNEAYHRDLTLFIACYDEEEGIVPTIEKAVAAATEAGITYDIVVVDDASKDNSVQVVRDYMARFAQLPIRLVINTTNQGVGSNFAEAALHGRGKYYRMMCGDDTESVETLVSVFKRLGEADMILTYHSNTRARTLLRRSLSRVFTITVNLLSGYKIQYYNGLPLHLRHNVLRWHSNTLGFGFHAELITRLLDMGATYIEIPVIPQERAAGRTKAFTFRNFCSVGHSLLEIMIRRFGKLLYPDLTTQLRQGQLAVDNPGFLAEAGFVAGTIAGETKGSA